MKHFNYNRLGDENQPVFGRGSRSKFLGSTRGVPSFFSSSTTWWIAPTSYAIPVGGIMQNQGE